MSAKSIKKDRDIKVLFVHAGDASFEDIDRHLLKKNFNVTSLKYSGKMGILKLLRGMLRCHVGFAWFEHDHAFFTVLFSKIFRKKSIVVAAGAMTLAAEWEKLKPNFKSKFVAKFSTKHAHRVFAVSQYKKDHILRYVRTDNIRVVYHGFDSEHYKPANVKEDMIITIGEVNEVNFWRKGFNTFVQAADSFPEVKFVIIGKHTDSSVEKLQQMAPKNVKFTGWISDDELIRYMQRAKVYAQLSTYESFGCAVAEAMLCECVPVVTDRGSLPEVVGDVGFKVEYGNVKETIEAFRKALSSDRHEEARKRVMEKFPMENREKLIVTNIREILGRGD